MNYELVKQLQNAGFPQNYNVGSKYFVDHEIEVICNAIGYECDCFTSYDIKNPYRREIIYIPTLSELIEACGKEFESLGKSKNPEQIPFWASYGSNRKFGSTPEEAVATLWLELNKNGTKH